MFSIPARARCVKIQFRGLSKGALAGGFTREGLEQYAKRFWNEENDLQTNLFSQKLSFGCSQWLDSHHDTSGELAQAYFGSQRFLPERLLMSPFFLNQANLPEFKENDRFLAWEVTNKAPLEVICSCEFGEVKGLTMMAFDPRLQRLYHGNSVSVDSQTSQTKAFSLMNQFRIHYAKFLLDGMANALEQLAV